ncbi:MAG: SOS response-associated peptidase family protein [Pyrinomonadaceae bacterium]
MCGRYKMTADERALYGQMPFLESDEYFDIHGYKKRPEIFPGEYILAVNNHLKAEDVWWTIEDFDYKGVWRRAINARAETVHFTDMFRDGFAHDRILIPATAIFEWQDDGRKSNKKYEIWFDEPVFAFAGLARECQIKGESKRCAVIITTTPNEVFSLIHNSKRRQAVVIHKYDYEKWLDPATPLDDLKRLMEPVGTEETHFALAEEPASPQASLFCL